MGQYKDGVGWAMALEADESASRSGFILPPKGANEDVVVWQMVSWSPI